MFFETQRIYQMNVNLLWYETESSVFYADTPVFTGRLM